jgi:hypothetical protein
MFYQLVINIVFWSNEKLTGRRLEMVQCVPVFYPSPNNVMWNFMASDQFHKKRQEGVLNIPKFQKTQNY